jgi:radical SAM protein with 4Fe4S-binding SPASM domain
MDEMAGFAKSLGADSMNFQNICGFNCANLSSQTLYIEDLAIVEYIKNLKNKYSDFHITYPRTASKDKSQRGCCQPFDSMTVDADGNVGPCSVIVPNPNSAYGNLFRDENIWNNKAYQKLRAPLVDGKLPLGSSFCEDCTFLHGGLF